MKYVLSLFLISTITTAFSQVSGNSRYHQTVPETHRAQAVINDGQITLTVSGLLNAKADTFVAFFNLTQVGETVASTDSLMTLRINRFKAALRRQRRDTLVVHTDMISFVPKYDIRALKRVFSKTYNEVPDGFELQKNVTVTYHTAADLNMIVSAAAQAEIYDLVKVDYFLSNVKKYYDQLRTQCQEAMKVRIKYLESMGIRVDTLRKAFDDDFATVLPQTRYGSYSSVSRPSLSAMRKDDVEVMKVRSVEASPSKYYEAVPYAQYDVVINPVVAEPTVQLTYQMSLKYTVPEEKAKLMLVTPNGHLQKIGEM
jgi:uncharacterized protein YggE